MRLHDRTRRRLGLAAFLVLGLLPTVATLAWGIVRHSSWHGRSEAERLSRELGLRVSLTGVRHLRPGWTAYEGLKVSDPEIGAVVLGCRRLDAWWTVAPGSKGSARPLLVLIAADPVMHASQLHHVARLVEELLKQRAGWSGVDVSLCADTLTLEQPDGRQSLVQVRAGAETFAEGTQAQASFRLAHVESPEPVRIRLGRNRRTTPPANVFEVDTGDGTLPCSLLALGIEATSAWWSSGRFRGVFWAGETPDGWTGEIKGELLDVDLEQVVGGRFPHRLSGTAKVCLESARFHHGRLQDVSGSIEAGPGKIGQSLVEAGVRRLGLRPGSEPAPSSPDGMLPYERLHVLFFLNNRGVWLRGQCKEGGPGAVVIDPSRVLLREPEIQPQPIAALVQTLVPAGEAQVAVTRQTDWLLRRLPLPDAAAPVIAERPDPTAQSPTTSVNR